jgi:hypothetical protein
MKRLLPLVLLGAVAAEPQNAPMESLCIAFSQESSSSTNASAKDPLEAAVMTSGDFDFYPSVTTAAGRCTCFLCRPITRRERPWVCHFAHRHRSESVEVGHALTFGPVERSSWKQ